MANQSEEEARADLVWERVRPFLQDRFKFVRWLGAGAFGDVCEAVQESTGQRVAIKMLRAVDNPAMQSRFLREMRACAALHHPHVVRLLDSGCGTQGEADGTGPLYTVFEYVPGQTLEQMLAAEGMLGVRQSIDLMLQVLDALLAAHDLGIVHRDLKPSNIMVTQTAGGLKAKVLDFGVAGVVHSQLETPVLTQTGDRIGTPAYCAPEQLQGAAPSPRMDYYAWGLVLVECLTGQRVFSGRALAQILQAQLSPEPVPLPAVLARHRLGSLLRWLLEKAPARRMPEIRPLLSELPALDVSSLVDAAGFLRTGPAFDSGGAEAVTEVATPGRAHDERRSATALCCRLELLDAPPAQLDEALDEWLGEVRQSIAEACGRYGGVSAGSATGEQVFYFGLTPREEAGVLRAARCALEVRELHQSLLGPREDGWRLGIRIGLHQGMVTLQAHNDQRLPAPGSLSLRASQLCSLCAPGEIALSPEVRGLLHTTMQTAERPLGTSSVALLISSTGGEQGVALVTIGRESELERLHNFWSDASVRFVAICGQPGVGKSHLARAWPASLTSERPKLRVAACTPDRQGSSLHPVIDLLRSRFGALNSQGAVDELKRVLLDSDAGSELSLNLLLSLLRGPEQPFHTPISPKKRRELLLGALIAVLAEMDREPALYIIEDMQWADPTSLEIIRGVCARQGGSRKLIVGTLRTGALADTGSLHAEPLSAAARAEGMRGLLSDAATRRLDLSELDDQAAKSLLLTFRNEDGQDGALLDQIVMLSAGIPLFLVELARSRSVSLRSLPASTADVLQQRIDELGAARRTAQLIAVAGSGVDSRFLSELLGGPGSLLGDLSYLVQTGILRLESDGSYAFVHALLRDSAYQSIGRKDRVRWHETVAEALERQEARTGQSRPWLVASHFRQAERLEPALMHAERAAMTALMQFANLEALSYARTVINPEQGWLRDLSDPTQRDLVELRLLGIATTALMQTRGWSDQEFDRACERALTLFQTTPVEASLPLRYALALLHFNRGYAIETGEESAPSYIAGLLSAAEAAHASAFTRLGHLMLGAFQLFHGSPTLGIGTLRMVDQGPLEDAWLYGFDAHINARSVEALARWCMGDADVAAFSEETLRMASACGHPGTDAMARMYHGTVLQLAGERDATKEHCTELLKSCERYGLQGPPAYATIMLAWADDNPELAEATLAAQLAAGQRLMQAWSEAMIAEAEIRLGRYQTARARLLRIEKVAERSEQLFLPYVLYLRAICDSDEAAREAEALRAIGVAVTQHCLGLARALAERARAWLGGNAESRAVLEDKLAHLMSEPAPRNSGIRLKAPEQDAISKRDAQGS